MKLTTASSLLICATPFVLLIIGQWINAPLLLVSFVVLGAAWTVPAFARTQSEKEFREERRRKLRDKLKP